MNHFISLEEINNCVEKPKKELPKFVTNKGPDPKAAAMRHYLVEELLKNWYDRLNDSLCDTRDMPEELKRLYDKACNVMITISEYEKSLM